MTTKPRQTRRSLSISKTLYESLRAHAATHGSSGSGIVEREMRKFLGLPQKDVVTRSRPPTEKEREQARRLEEVEPLFSQEAGFPKPVYSARL